MELLISIGWCDFSVTNPAQGSAAHQLYRNFGLSSRHGNRGGGIGKWWGWVDSGSVYVHARIGGV